MPYHIVKSKGGFQVIAISQNGKVLSTSEVMKSKRSAFNNFEAQINLCDAHGDGSIYAEVQDDTKDIPELWEFDDYTRTRIFDRSYPKYIPGKNPVKKKK